VKLNLPEYSKTKYWCKSYPKGLPSDVTVPRVGLPQLIEEAVRENHGRVTMLYGGEEITCDALGNQIGHFASGHHRSGDV